MHENCLKMEFTCTKVQPEVCKVDGVDCTLECVTLTAPCPHDATHENTISLHHVDVGCFKVGCCYCVEIHEAHEA